MSSTLGGALRLPGRSKSNLPFAIMVDQLIAVLPPARAVLPLLGRLSAIRCTFLNASISSAATASGYHVFYSDANGQCYSAMDE